MLRAFALRPSPAKPASSVRLAALLLLASCAIAQPKHNGIAVFVDAVPEAAGVQAAFEKKLVREGYEIVRGSEGASLAFHLDQRSVLDRGLRPGAPGTYTLEVTKGALAGKQVESFDPVCRDVPETPFECHAETFLRELQDAGVLKPGGLW
jgi:hypothetical protein